ncbi:hypothetical protein ES703_04011 [subsurface metagenome]
MNKNTQPKDRPEQEELKLYEFKLSDFNKIVFAITDFRDKRYINIRTWTRVHPGQQEWGRTHKGIFVDVSNIKDVQEGIKRLAEYLNTGQPKKEREDEKKKTSAG